MTSSGPAPDAWCYTEVLKALAGRGEVAQAVGVFEEMNERGVAPSVWCYNVVITALCKAGGFREAQGLLQEMRGVVARGVDASKPDGRMGILGDGEVSGTAVGGVVGSSLPTGALCSDCDDGEIAGSSVQAEISEKEGAIGDGTLDQPGFQVTALSEAVECCEGVGVVREVSSDRARQQAGTTGASEADVPDGVTENVLWKRAAGRPNIVYGGEKVRRVVERVGSSPARGEFLEESLRPQTRSSNGGGVNGLGGGLDEVRGEHIAEAGPKSSEALRGLTRKQVLQASHEHLSKPGVSASLIRNSGPHSHSCAPERKDADDEIVSRQAGEKMEAGGARPTRQGTVGLESIGGDSRTGGSSNDPGGIEAPLASAAASKVRKSESVSDGPFGSAASLQMGLGDVVELNGLERSWAKVEVCQRVGVVGTGDFSPMTAGPEPTKSSAQEDSALQVLRRAILGHRRSDVRKPPVGIVQHAEGELGDGIPFRPSKSQPAAMEMATGGEIGGECIERVESHLDASESGMPIQESADEAVSVGPNLRMDGSTRAGQSYSDQHIVSVTGELQLDGPYGSFHLDGREASDAKHSVRNGSETGASHRLSVLRSSKVDGLGCKEQAERTSSSGSSDAADGYMADSVLRTRSTAQNRTPIPQRNISGARQSRPDHTGTKEGQNACAQKVQHRSSRWGVRRAASWPPPPAPDAVTYNILIGASVHEPDGWRTAVELLGHMREDGVAPSQLTYNSVSGRMDLRKCLLV
jgi:pentatricopeptide repeat protein